MLRSTRRPGAIAALLLAVGLLLALAPGASAQAGSTIAITFNGGSSTYTYAVNGGPATAVSCASVPNPFSVEGANVTVKYAAVYGSGCYAYPSGTPAKVTLTGGAADGTTSYLQTAQALSIDSGASRAQFGAQTTTVVDETANGSVSLNSYASVTTFASGQTVTTQSGPLTTTRTGAYGVYLTSGANVTIGSGFTEASGVRDMSAYTEADIAITGTVSGPTELRLTGRSITQIAPITSPRLVVDGRGTTGGVALTNAGNTFSSLAVQGATRPAAFRTAASLTLNAVTHSTQPLSVSADGSLTIEKAEVRRNDLICGPGGIGGIGGMPICTDNYTYGDLTLAAGGTITQNGAISTANLTVSAGGSVSLPRAANRVTAVTGTAGATFALATSEALQLGTVASPTTMTIDAGGAVTQTAASTVTAGTLYVRGAGISLPGANAFGTVVPALPAGATTGDVVLNATQSYVLGGGTFPGAVSATSDGTLALTAPLTAKTVAFTADGLDLGGNAVTADSIVVRPNSADTAIVVGGTGPAALSLSATDVAALKTTDLTLGSLTTGPISIASGVDGTGGTLTLIGDGVRQSGTVKADTLKLRVAGVATLTQAGNLIGALDVTAGADVRVTTSDTLQVLAADVGTADLTLQATGITQTGAITAGGVDATATAGAVLLQVTTNAIDRIAGSAKTDFRITSGKALEVGSITAPGDLWIVSAGAVTTAQDAIVKAGDVSLKGTSVALTGADNELSTVALDTAGGDALVEAATSFTLKTVGRVDELSATSGGTLTLTGTSVPVRKARYVADGLVQNATTAATESIEVAPATAGRALTVGGAPVAGTLNVLATKLDGPTLTIGSDDAGAVTLAAAVDQGVGTLVLRGSTVAQAGPITVDLLDVAVTGSTPIDLSDDGNLITRLRVAGPAAVNAKSRRTLNGLELSLDDADATVEAAGSIALAASTLGTGTLTLSTPANAGVTQAGALSAAGLVLHAGAVTLTDAGNAVGSISGSASGVALTTTTALELAGLDAGGAATFAAGGAVTTKPVTTNQGTTLTVTGTSIDLADLRFATVRPTATTGDVQLRAFGDLALEEVSTAGGLDVHTTGTLSTTAVSGDAIELQGTTLTLLGAITGSESVIYVTDTLAPGAFPTTAPKVTVKPLTDERPVTFGGDAVAGTLSIPASGITAADLKIGSATAGPLTIGAGVDRSGTVRLRSGGAITGAAFTAAVLDAEAADVDLAGDNAIGSLTAKAAGAVVVRSTVPLAIAEGGVQAGERIALTAPATDVDGPLTAGTIELVTNQLGASEAIEGDTIALRSLDVLPVRLGTQPSVPSLWLSAETLDHITAERLEVAAGEGQDASVRGSLSSAAIGTLALKGSGITGDEASLGFAGVELDDVSGEPQDWAVSPQGAGPIALDGVKTLKLAATGSFDVTPGDGFDVAIAGGEPGPNTLTYQAGSRRTTQAPGTIGQTGRGTVTYSGIDTVTIADDASADLSSLKTSAGELSPAFDPATDAYAVALGADVEGTTLSFTTADPAATVAVDGTPVQTPRRGAGRRESDRSVAVPVTLPQGGSQTVRIDVTADGAQRTTTVAVTRAKPAPVVQPETPQTPATPQAPQAPAAPASVQTGTLGLQVPEGTPTVASNPVVNVAGAAPITCTLGGQPMRSCAVEVVLARSLKLPRKVKRNQRLGTGASQAGGAAVAVPLTLTKRAKRLMAERPLGIGAVVRLTAVTADGRTVTTTRYVRLVQPGTVRLKLGKGLERRLAKVAKTVPAAKTIRCMSFDVADAKAACQQLEAAGVEAAFKSRKGGRPGVVRIALRY